MQCTFVNAVIAVALSAVVVFGGAELASVPVGVAAGGVLLLLSAGSIWLRGYLVPGTPTLTKRYFPGWVLGWFGKADAAVEAEQEGAVGDRTQVDPEEALLSAGALEECQDGAELCLTDSFRSSWYEEIERVDAADAGRERLLDLLDAEDAEVSFEEYDDEAFTALVDGRTVGTWESRAAFLADLGAANALAARLDGWDGLPVHARSQLLNGLRLFIDECPACGGTPDFGTETVESCCSTHDVAAVECHDCGARLFESSPI